MKTDDWPVSEEAVRRSGPPGVCYQCEAKVGAQHLKNCVFRRQTIMVAAKITVLLRLPEDWREGDVNFYLNQSSWCASSIIDSISLVKGCLCDQAEFEFLREATLEDEEQWEDPRKEETT